ncbi:MAG TPA: class II fumarate hydratase [Candidatus Didemnitutus sp.]|nr:class II fumarate hydratase [Candidatus Didemnitutus sp.]
MRIEQDSMGKLEVPDEALYGASTQRAVLNFPVSGHTMPKRLVRTLALLKIACAQANEELGLLPAEKAAVIRKAAAEILDGQWLEQFPVDVFQTGSGTSTNMNMNEVIANRCNQLIGEPLGSKRRFHPNDDVNRSQSSNDLMPSVLHISVAVAIHEELQTSLMRLVNELDRKARAFAGIVKPGRTHLMDAVPLTLGQEFSGYAEQIRKASSRALKARDALMELAIGGTAVGTGLNCPTGFAERVCAVIAERTGLPFREARNHFEAQGARDDAVEVAGHLATISSSLLKIANDLRLLGSGPRNGIGEIRLPEVQPGSSIMPGKVNPVMCEMVIQVAIHVQGLCHAVIMAGGAGQLELNATIPLMAHELHEAIECLSNAVGLFTDRCVVGIEADEEQCRRGVERSLMSVTALAPAIGYDQAAQLAKKALQSGKTIAEVAKESDLIDPKAIAEALDPAALVKSRD